MLSMPVERTRADRRNQRHNPNTAIPSSSEVLHWVPSTHQSFDAPFSFQDDDDLPPLVLPPPSPPEDGGLPPLVDGTSFDFMPPEGAMAQKMFFLPPLEDAPPPSTPEATLFPEGPEHTAPRPSHHKKRPADHIPRPPNAFILFRASFIKAQHIPGTIEPNNNTLSRIIGLCWKGLPEEERQVWKEKARKAMEEHKRLYPSYRYNPRDQQNRARSAGSAKRKVKEISGPPADPERCQEIARMLVEGKKGDELEDAVNQFDFNAKVQSPEQVRPIVHTRFDPPMTERTFRRRSSSLPPLPKDEEETPRKSPSQSKSKRVSKKRSSSTGTRSRSRNTAPQTKEEDLEDHSLAGKTEKPDTPFKYYASHVSPEAAMGGYQRSHLDVGAIRSPDNLSGSSAASSPGILGSRPSPIIASVSPTVSSFPVQASPSPPFPPPESPDTPLLASPLSPVPGTPITRDPLNAAVVLMEAEFTSTPGIDEALLPVTSVASRVNVRGVPSSTFSSLEGWDGLNPRYRDQLDASGSYSVGPTGLHPPFLPIVESSSRVPSLLTGHASEYSGQHWTTYETPQTYETSQSPHQQESVASSPAESSVTASPSRAAAQPAIGRNRALHFAPSLPGLVHELDFPILSPYFYSTASDRLDSRLRVNLSV